MSVTALPGYAELHCLSNFSFLRGASHPEELCRRAAELGYRALALTDECSVAGVVRAYMAARELPLQLIIGSEFRLVDGLRCVLLPVDRHGYAQLCELITRGRRAAPKGEYCLSRRYSPLGAGVAPRLKVSTACSGRTCSSSLSIAWLSGCLITRRNWLTHTGLVRLFRAVPGWE